MNPVSPEASNQVRSALPSRLARAGAFASILVGGLCGALIGFAVTDVSCTGDCTTWLGLGTLIGALSAAVGVGVVAILALRAMDEWQETSNRTTSP